MLVVLLQLSHSFAAPGVDEDKVERNGSRNDIIIADEFLDDLFVHSKIVVKNVELKNIDQRKVDINLKVDFDLTYLCNSIELNTVPVLNLPSYNSLIATGLGLSYYFFANEKEKPILRFTSSEEDRRSSVLKEYIDKIIFRYLIIQINNNYFDQIFLSSRSGISLKDSFELVISGVPASLLDEGANLTILIVDKKRPRYSGAPEVHQRIIVKKEYPLPLH